MKADTNKTFIIAEAGVNHNGSLKKALKLIDIATSAGANAIKFQTFKAENLATDYAPKAEYQKYKSLKKETQFQMLKKLEFTEAMHNVCLQKCQKKKIIFISSAFDIESLYYLKKFKLNYFKVPSGEITNIPYLETLGRFGKKIILSTGMSRISEIKKAVKTFDSLNVFVDIECYISASGGVKITLANNSYSKIKPKLSLSIKIFNKEKELIETKDVVLKYFEKLRSKTFDETYGIKGLGQNTDEKTISETINSNDVLRMYVSALVVALQK